jgi:amino-acid N-acetyltransferase
MLNRQLDQGLIPIIPNIGWNAVGKDYNLNSSELAVEVAKAMEATKLFFLGDEPGIPIVPDCGFVEPGELETGLFSNLDAKEGQKLLAKHGEALLPHHREWVALSVRALQSGVDRVHFIDGTQDGRLLQEVFSSTGFGTMFTISEWGDIHPAHPEDIPEMLRIMQPYVERGVLVQRQAEQLGEELDQFVVYKVDDALFGCAALNPYTKQKSGEIHGVIVDPSYSGKGVGRKLVDYLGERTKKLGLTKVFLLTTQTSDFFMRLGFEEGELSSLPEDRRKGFNKSRNSRIYLKRIR